MVTHIGSSLVSHEHLLTFQTGGFYSSFETSESFDPKVTTLKQSLSIETEP